MRIVAYESARVTALFSLEEVMPLGGANGRELIPEIQSRYEFIKTTDIRTTSREEINKNGFTFEGGRFEFEGSTVNISDMAIYLDGIVVNAAKTDYAEAFIHDLINFTQKSFGFRELASKPRFYFLSQIIVEFEKPLANLISKFSQLSEMINEQLSPSYGKLEPVDFARLDFELDKKSMPVGMTVPRIVIERRTNIPFNKERYFCGAPMRTSGHIQFLEEVERVLIRAH